MTKPIILAPAGGFAAVTAAVRCGADAVYLGAKNFNARRNAENFDDLALPETVKFCHERGTKVFVTVNTLVTDGEMDALRQMLHAAVDVLGEGGRLSVLTYHSLEDRMVKNVMKSGNEEGKLETDVFGRSHAPMKPLSNKPQIPTEQEQAENPRSRSAKLRVAVKLAAGGGE